ncbi:hypothetical protein [Rhodanobacter sp. BL-MT-08]
MRSEQKSAIDRRESSRRVAVWVAVIACHLGFLMLFFPPAIDHSDTNRMAKTKRLALQLRFVTLPRLIPMPVASSSAQASRSPRYRTIARIRRMAVPTVHTIVSDSPSPAATPAISPLSIPAQAPNQSDPNADGGFGKRLREAQHGSATHGIPGSDKALVSGIEFVNPMDQGVGAVARQAQRLFGIKSRQCIDVEAWRTLTTQELLARHISPDDVNREDEKYQCNAPPGLHF